MFTLLHNKVSAAGGRRHFCHHLKNDRHSGDSMGRLSSGAAPSCGQEESQIRKIIKEETIYKPLLYV